MDVRFAIIAAAILAAGSAVAAEPPKPTTKDAAQPSKRPAPVILASADQVPTPLPADQNAQPPVKHRAARVTTCRCGDQVEDQPEQ